MQKITYEKPKVGDIAEENKSQSIQLAGVRTSPAILLKKELKKRKK